MWRYGRIPMFQMTLLILPSGDGGSNILQNTGILLQHIQHHNPKDLNLNESITCLLRK